MLARALRFALVGEIGSYAALAFFLTGPGSRPSAGFVVATVVCAALGLRLAVMGMTWAYVGATRRPLPVSLRIGPPAVAAMVIADYLALVALFVVIQPFERIFMGKDRLAPQAPGGRPPLLLIHGYHCNRGFWWWLRGRLERAGWQVATISLEPIFADIDAYADQVAARVAEIRATTGAGQVVLVGHSMGGVVARAYLRRHGAAAVARLVTLGSPHQGSLLANHFGLGPNGRQMKLHGTWIEALGQVPLAVSTVSIYSVHDNFVVPQVSSELAGACNLPLAGVGHIAMAFSPSVCAALLEALRARD